MELIVNGRFLCQQATGVQRVSREFVLALDRLIGRGEFAGLAVCLMAPRGVDLASLELRNIAVEHLAGGAGYFWEQVALPLRTRNAILLCLGNTAPLLGFISGHVGVMLHDQAHRLFPQDYSRCYRLVHTLMEYFILRFALPLIAVSLTEAEALRHNNDAPLPNLLVAPNGGWARDLADPHLRSAVDQGERFVLYVGGFSDRKNVDGVFEAARILADRDVLVRLVGEPNDRCATFLTALSKRQRSRIHFCGYVDDEALGMLYSKADCLMYPSFYEASGLPPIEAMHFGCPVVVSDLPVLHERCGDSALYCNPSDPRAIAARVLEIVDDPQLASSLSASALERAKQFTWENQARLIVHAAIEAHPLGNAPREIQYTTKSAPAYR
jgi:glycosyltransferase involved in cell wall biosynthesis